MSETKPELTNENIIKHLIERFQNEKREFPLTLEQLADFAHYLWYEMILFYLQNDPEVEISEEKVAYWETHCFMPYESLSEEQKLKDRKMVLQWLYKNNL